jgi:DNA-binding NtrC family response regulator
VRHKNAENGWCGIVEAVKKIKPEIPIVMISGHGDMETAINTRLGAFDYISKPRFKPIVEYG